MLQRISEKTLRRYVLGRQGLWPGRRWRGRSGVIAALESAEVIQVDPLKPVARNHDLALHARVADFSPDMLDHLLYRDREFFDYGGTVFIYPMTELRYVRVAMERRRADARWSTFVAENSAVITSVRKEIERAGPLAARDLSSGSQRTSSFRSGRTTSRALYYLWLVGELMTHHRLGFERVYDLRERVAPPAHDREVTAEEAEEYLFAKALRFLGAPTAREWGSWFYNFTHSRMPPREGTARLIAMAGDLGAAAVSVDGSTEHRWVPEEEVATLQTIERGDVPVAWEPLDERRPAQVSLLAPLDIVSARGRAGPLFDFEYVWEVYKPAAKRRWGYYTLPVRYGDRLVARVDPKFDAKTATLVVLGLWLEDPALADDPDFHDQFGHELARLGHLVGATSVDLAAVEPPSFADALSAAIARGAEPSPT